ncbi:MAG: hypothetical protein A4S09_13335 [Proteobacteria bacterium SG_bin7]|nr:MAG: hypothetical protein A4S09_13335 [Proteobacteria bacterium SG_bin7]
MRKLFFGLLLLTNACSGIVKKPDVFNIKKLAIVGIQTNQGIYSTGEIDRGFTFFSFPVFLGKGAVEPLMLPQIPATGGFRLVDFGLNTFEEELGKIRGWQVVPAIKVVGSPAYKEFSKTIQNIPGRSVASELISNWYSPQGMTPIGDQNKVLKKDTMKEIQKIASQLGLDAVVFVDMDLAYAPDHSINMGAFASVASSLKVIAKTGAIVVSTPEVKNGSGERYFSDTSSPGLGKQLVFNDEIEAMYKAAIQKSAASLREKINKEL